MSAGLQSQMNFERLDAPGGLVRRLAGDAARRLAGGDPGGLVSVTWRLPGGMLPATADLSPHVYWRTPDDGVELLARGEALKLTTTGGDTLERHLSAWRTLGDAASPPSAFFTVQPPPRTAAASVWWPAVLVRRTAEADEVTFTAPCRETHDGIERIWEQEWDRLLARPHRDGPATRATFRKQLTPPARDWLNAVSATLAEIEEGRLEKAVLARRLTLDLPRPLDPVLLAQRLIRDHDDCHVLVVPHDGGHVVAASPERLAAKRGNTLVCDALAGTTRRAAMQADEDRETAALLACPKQRHEHALVVDGIVAALRGACDHIAAAESPKVRRLRSLLHLWTEVGARLRPGHGLLDIVARLHPTAAILGSPSTDARRWLDKLGERRDGLYTGLAGRIDSRGDGEAIVVLRSAYLTRQRAVLWAGAGIVAGSRPLNELREIELKLDTMREALGCS